ncbi:MAG: methyltransferase family protein [Anaerolineae bacterium]
MNNKPSMPRWLSRVLRPAFGLFLFLAQFTASRTTLFTESVPLLLLGIVLVIAGNWLWISASIRLRKATTLHAIAAEGPYKYIRHPIYVSIYLLSLGLGCIFFAWLWFGVLLAFVPLWYLECMEEERQMMKIYGEEYVAYQQSTGMFFPKIGV